MCEFEEDLKQNGSKSRFYKYVQEKNIQKFKGNLKGRMRMSRKVTAETIVCDKQQPRRLITGENSTALNSVNARRAVSEVNINVTEGCVDNAAVIAMNSETIARKQYSASSNRDDHDERRWSASMSQAENQKNLIASEMKIDDI